MTIHWTIRYLVADTGNWIPGRQVLISPYALVAVNDNEQYLAVDWTKKQIEDSPSLDSHKVVSRQFEKAYYGYYGWPGYGVPYVWGPYPYIVKYSSIFREHIKQSPEYTEESLITRDYETHLHRHYKRQGYWIDELAAKEHAR